MVRAMGLSGRRFGYVGLIAGTLLMVGGWPAVIKAADDLPKESVLPAALAGKAVQAALDHCKKDGYRVSASVVDRAGVLRAMIAPDPC